MGIMTDKSSNYMENMGYSEKAGYIFVVIFSFLSILMNMIFIINYLLKSSVNKEKRKISSFEQILFILSISESFISLLWFLSATRFSQKKKLLKEGSEEEICLGCKILGLVKLFAYVFDWVLSGFTMFHLKNMILNPIKFILKPFKKIMFYVLISIIFALIIVITSYILDLIGVSPLITCFLAIDKKENDLLRNILVIIFISTPLYNLIFFFI